MHVYVYTTGYMYINKYLSMYMYTPQGICTQINIYACICIHHSVYVHKWISIHIYVYTRVYMYTNKYLCVHIYTPEDKSSDVPGEGLYATIMRRAIGQVLYVYKEMYIFIKMNTYICKFTAYVCICKFVQLGRCYMYTKKYVNL